MHAIIDTTSVWKPVVEAIACLKPGGRLVINAIRKESRDKNELPRLSCRDHLWMEKEVETVTNITQHDTREFLPIAAAIGIRTPIKTLPLGEANKALHMLKRGDVVGALVLQIANGD